MVRLGDVVSCRQWPGEIWAVLGPVDNAVRPGEDVAAARSQAVGRACPPGHKAGEGDLELIARPTFEPGQQVSYDGSLDGIAEVIADNGDTVRIRVLQIRPRGLRSASGVLTTTTHELDVGRGELVAENL